MSEEKIKKIRDEVVETLKTYFTEDAQEILKEIDKLKNDPEISSDSSKIEELSVYNSLMKFIVFATLPETEQLGLFRSFLVKAFRLGIDVKNRFSIKMNLTPDILWPETVQIFVEAMLQNEEKLGGRPIVVLGEKEEVLPTLRNWLRDYNRIYGMDRHEKIIPHRYLTENPNAQKLNREDQVLLLNILEFYEGLKFPSQNQINAALDKALDQYLEENEDISEELDVSEEETVLKNLDSQLQANSDDYFDNDIESLIGKYPKVSDQLVTKQPIKLIFNNEWVKPTVSNWLADYRAYVGVGAHEINERSDYLMRSPNVQNLSLEERERLGLLLRSYDEKYMLPFSASKQEIIFNRIKSSL